MTDPKKHPSAAFWAAVVMVVALVAYPLSLGPPFWVNQRTGIGGRFIRRVYRPFMPLIFLDSAPPILRNTLNWYACLEINGDEWPCPSARPGMMWVKTTRPCECYPGYLDLYIDD